MQETKVQYPAIEPAPGAPSSPLSFQQERLLYLSRLAADSPLWNRLSCKRLVGEVDVQAMKAAVVGLTERHSVLRTRIFLEDGEPRQATHEVLIGAFRSLDVSAREPGDAEERAHAILRREYEQPVSLLGGELFRATLVRYGAGELLLILKLHHVISDATTFRILWHDLKALYNARLGGGEPLALLTLDYSDYARWIREQLTEERTREQESYWLRLFDGELPGLDLPTDFPVPKELTFNGAVERRTLGRETVKHLQSFSLDTRVIPFSTLLSAFVLLLGRLGRTDDLVVGTVFSGRHYSPRLRNLAGFFSTTVALRLGIDRAQRVDELVRSVHEQVADAYAMQDYPFERLVETLDPERGQSRNPLFRVLFNLVAERPERIGFRGVRSEEWVQPPVRATQVDLFLDVRMSSDGAELRFEYNSDLFAASTIRRLLGHYQVLVEQMLSTPSASVEDLDMLDAAERERVLTLATGAPAPAPPAATVVELLERRAACTPGRTALLFDGGSVTCDDFNRRVNRLAATLIASGVGDGDVVGLMCERSPEMVAGVFAILKAGAAYLPLDPALPRERVDYLLADSGARCLLVEGSDRPAADGPGASAPLPRIELGDAGSSTGTGENPGRPVAATSAAYVIYTSGSTGKPKGVVVEHGALMNTLWFMERTFPRAGKTLLLKTSFTFDVSCTELFGWLFDDGRLALLAARAEGDARKLVDAIDAHEVTHVNFVPSMLDTFLSVLKPEDLGRLEGLEVVFAAGEALAPDVVNRFSRQLPQARLENLYGPTEAAIYATWHSPGRDGAVERVPIGKPISGTRAYVFDERLRLLPVGVTGELCLAGPGLARGYLGDPVLTEQRFRPDPYRAGERLYRTGDLARWNDDGSIQFLGRADRQVKVRGFRVELGEVEQRLRACKEVAEGVVAALEHPPGQQCLVAYFTAAGPTDASAETLRRELARWLPAYMIPDHFVQLERLPRLPSGKIDRRALPHPADGATAPARATGDASEIESIVIGIAEDILDTRGLGPDSNFFRLGGNSLLTLRFIAALDEAFGTTLSGMDFLALPTMAEIARIVEPSVAAPVRDAPAAVPAAEGSPVGAGDRS